MNKTLLPLLMLPLALPAATWYVGGEQAANSNTGSQQSPWATLQHAALHIKAGDTVIVAPGDYPEAVVVTARGTETAPVTFRAEPSRQAKVSSFELQGDYITIDGFDITNDAPHESSFGVSCGQAHLETARTGCRILNNSIHDIVGTAIYSGENALVKGNLMKNVYRGVFANSGTLVENNEVDTLVPYMVEKDGMMVPKKTQYTFFNGEDITFRGNYLHGAPEEYLSKGMGVCFFSSWDGWIYTSSHRILIENNRCFNSTHASEPTATERKASSHITFRNNLFVNTVYVGVLCKQWSHITIENNTFVNCGAYPVWFQTLRETEGSRVVNNIMTATTDYDPVRYGSPGAESGIRVDNPDWISMSGLQIGHNMMWVYLNRSYSATDFTAEPQFVDPANRDFRLKPGSPGVNRGIPTDLKTDLLGTPRPQGKGYDIGAYETIN